VKFDDKPQNKDSKIKTISPQSAMDAYFDDMFGSVENDPLKKLSANQFSSVEGPSSKAMQEALEVQVNNLGLSKLSENSAAQSLIPKPKKQILHFNAPSFDEPEMITGKVSPLIIPAAFPKLAPFEPKIKTDVLMLTDDQQSLAQKTKLDAKTALSILEKQKSKLSITQRQRLEEKLKLLSKAKQEESVLAISKTVTSQIKPVIIEKTVIETQAKKTNLEAIKNVQIAEVVTPTISEQSISFELKPQKNSRPEWANGRFECLIFSVAGLKLAVPLISLGAIYKIEKDFIPLVGRASWFIGIYHHLERNVRVIDTAQLVMPERCSEQVRSGYKFIIRLGGNDWGMACDAVHQSIQLYPDQVKWRTERTKRAWLFGTVIDHMCALIDADSLSSLLNQQASGNPRVFSE
tara:strand:- start:12714 stop:13931 length:1218 start_codon:yes stop_codon:yes gene_type:complete